MEVENGWQVNKVREAKKVPSISMRINLISHLKSAFEHTRESYVGVHVMI